MHRLMAVREMSLKLRSSVMGSRESGETLHVEIRIELRPGQFRAMYLRRHGAGAMSFAAQ